MQSPLRAAAALILPAALALVGCASIQAPALTPAEIGSLLASPDRTAADRTNDQRRKPDQLLAFIAPRRGMVALDVSAGGGYTTELLARAVGPTGKVYGQRPPPRDPNRPAVAPAQPEGDATGRAPAPAAPAASAPAAPRNPAGPIVERDARLRAAGTPAAPLISVVQGFNDPVPAEASSDALDLVTLMFNYHDLGFLGVDRAQMNRAIFRALKPGGSYVIADHAGRPGTGISESGTLHRIEQAFLRQEVEAAGFKLAAEGDFLRNPNDPRDRNTPEPPQPKDEFVLKFVKPR